MIEVLHKAEAARHHLQQIRSTGNTLGFVPTMGALHDGHMSLVDRSLKENEITVVSIFINPTQFNDADDYSGYPRPLDDDLALLEKAGVGIAFCPSKKEIYPDGYCYRIQENSFSNELEGAFRPGHFDGVLTVVMKLLNIVAPNRAYFGEKDWQQYLLIREMATAFFLDMEIVSCRLVRDVDGLALSSRNALLSSSERAVAPRFFEILSDETPIKDKWESLGKAGFEVEYIEERDNRILAAVKLGGIRIIDNVKTVRSVK
ncbi:MAG: pantoate--beta-alanine ligase [Spirochaetales bacterium]|jgi:pantoate--beta-alanine ligase|nr:pantoate--beta-alanine ligase [Spirochaetales bacterium]